MSKEDSAIQQPRSKRRESGILCGYDRAVLRKLVDGTVLASLHSASCASRGPVDGPKKKGTTMPSQKCDKVSNGLSNQSLRNEVPAERPSSVLRPFPPIHSNVAGKKPHTAP
ncbi:hypothetical protein VFPPC_09209 [Pochonia chlamydosporia 170]|uniref:Uncharacterized protein n=1 Tax=Pochonia chlamydosporia 170 TaxID=1380566 RepID=A0A179FCQ3_METCM|nr:hypothetical protein VFPPC_09209 [Pochonia chlamydosporia 170]OAQ63355.2 hypothetical protein VFPPC_09209 [Pochonia chlamydosporia 170]